MITATIAKNTSASSKSGNFIVKEMFAYPFGEVTPSFALAGGRLEKTSLVSFRRTRWVTQPSR